MLERVHVRNGEMKNAKTSGGFTYIMFAAKHDNGPLPSAFLFHSGNQATVLI